jgi:hypothetical protein
LGGGVKSPSRKIVKIDFVWQENAGLTHVNTPQYFTSEQSRHCTELCLRLFILQPNYFVCLFRYSTHSTCNPPLMSSQEPVSPFPCDHGIDRYHSLQLRRKLVIVGDGESLVVSLLWMIYSPSQHRCLWKNIPVVYIRPRSIPQGICTQSRPIFCWSDTQTTHLLAA